MSAVTIARVDFSDFGKFQYMSQGSYKLFRPEGGLDHGYQQSSVKVKKKFTISLPFSNIKNGSNLDYSICFKKGAKSSFNTNRLLKLI